MPPAPVQPTNPSCDRCRNRKVKCTPLSDDELRTAREKGVGDRCKGCYRADKPCTREYIHKKPGRPLGSGARSRRSTSKSNRDSSPRMLSPTLTTALVDASLLNEDGTGPAFGSIFGSARNALYPGATTYAPSLPLFEPPVPSIGDMGLVGSSNTQPLAPLDSVLGAAARDELWPRTLPPNLLPSPSTTSHASAPVPSLSMPIELGGGKYEQGHNMEDVLPWTDVCFFVSLFLRDQHCLVPLVHKPTFSQDVLNRRDRRDEAFRGLLCSIIAYTICQCPISTMTGEYERPRLVTILHRCTKAADSIRLRQRMSPSLILLASTILDWITAQAVGNPQVCDLLIAETTRLTHALGLSEPNPRIATNVVETEICRRLYWIIYSKDKTDALSGRPIILHDFEGLPPLPMEVDDDYITTVGNLPQPEKRTSYMLGFVTIMRIFKIISQCVSRHRAFANLSADDDDDHASILRWIQGAQDRLHDIIDAVPANLKTNLADLADTAPAGDLSLFGIQQANITITALCAEFALLDFRASLRPDEDTRADREEMARKAYETLSSIPYEYLASNGESMRGKVLRIILALLSMTPEPINFSQNVWDWWNMYSRVQFLQVIPDETMILIDQNTGTRGSATPAASVSGSNGVPVPATGAKMPSPVQTMPA